MCSKKISGAREPFKREAERKDKGEKLRPWSVIVESPRFENSRNVEMRPDYLSNRRRRRGSLAEIPSSQDSVRIVRLRDLYFALDTVRGFDIGEGYSRLLSRAFSAYPSC